jgi:hypothetical protein
MLTCLLDRLLSNLFKIIKVGIIRTRKVITAFLSFALGAPPLQQDRYLAPAPYFHIFLGWRATAGPSNLRGPRLPPRLTPFDCRFWGHASGVPSLLRPIQNSSWSCMVLRKAARDEIGSGGAQDYGGHEDSSLPGPASVEAADLSAVDNQTIARQHDRECLIEWVEEDLGLLVVKPFAD